MSPLNHHEKKVEKISLMIFEKLITILSPFSFQADVSSHPKSDTFANPASRVNLYHFFVWFQKGGMLTYLDVPGG